MGEKTSKKGKKQIWMRDQLGRKTRMKYNTEVEKLQEIEQKPVEMQNTERTDPSHNKRTGCEAEDSGLKPETSR